MSGLLGLNLQHADLPTFFLFSLQETISIRKLVKFESLAHIGFFLKDLSVFTYKKMAIMHQHRHCIETTSSKTSLPCKQNFNQSGEITREVGGAEFITHGMHYYLPPRRGLDTSYGGD